MDGAERKPMIPLETIAKAMYVVVPAFVVWAVSMETRLSQVSSIRDIEERLHPLEVDYEVKRRLEELAGDSPVKRVAAGLPASKEQVESVRRDVQNGVKR